MRVQSGNRRRIGPVARQPCRGLVAMFALMALAGCAGHIGERIVRAPNLDHPGGMFDEDADAGWRSNAARHFFAEEAVIDSPVDGAGLYTAVMPAGNYPHSLTVQQGDEGRSIRFDAAAPMGPPTGPSRGTLIAVHGWQTEHRALMPHAMALANEGWDVVLYDQRGHGRSEGRYVTFGVHEARDLEAIIDWVRAREVYTPPLVLFGTSMGAATALLAAAESTPSAVVAVAPYARLEAALPQGLQELAPGYIQPFLSERRMHKAMAHASETSGVSFADAAPVDRADRIEVPVLLIYSEADQIVPAAHASELHEALGESSLERIDGLSHEGLLIDRDAVLDIAMPWLDDRVHNTAGP